MSDVAAIKAALAAHEIETHRGPMAAKPSSRCREKSQAAELGSGARRPPPGPRSPQTHEA
jgi:hypothetical protein